MKQRLYCLTGAAGALGAALVMAASTAQAAEFEFIGQGKLQPTFFDNFDLDDSSPDPATGTSAGAVQVGDEHVRAEIRLEAIASGDN